MEDVDDVNALFVYGTLVDLNFFQDIFSIKPEKVHEGWIFAVMFNCGNFPMILDHPDRKVYGRVYIFPALKGLLPVIDRYENSDLQPPEQPWYNRKIVQVFLSGERTMTAWAYIGNQRSPLCRTKCIEQNLIPDGKWLM